MRGKPRGGTAALGTDRPGAQNVRGQTPLFQDLADKRQAGNPTEGEWLKANVC